MSDEYLRAKAEELISELQQVMTQKSSLAAQLESIREALTRLEKYEGEKVFERAGAVFVERDKEDVILELKGMKDFLEKSLESLDKKEEDLRQTLNRMLTGTS